MTRLTWNNFQSTSPAWSIDWLWHYSSAYYSTCRWQNEVATATTLIKILDLDKVAVTEMDFKVMQHHQTSKYIFHITYVTILHHFHDIANYLVYMTSSDTAVEW